LDGTMRRSRPAQAASNRETCVIFEPVHLIRTSVLNRVSVFPPQFARGLETMVACVLGERSAAAPGTGLPASTNVTTWMC
jgi:hypothetical protein